jgi:hypothetical protein
VLQNQRREQSKACIKEYKLQPTIIYIKWDIWKKP